MYRIGTITLPLALVLSLGGLVAVDTSATADPPEAGWTQVDDGTGVHPDGEYDVAMALHPASTSRPAEVIAFGGYRNATDDYSANTWAWNGESWRLAATTGPPGVGNAAMARNRHGDLLLFGGSDTARIYRGTWKWDGTTWQKLGTGPVLASPEMAYYEDTGKVVLTGAPYNGAVMQTWIWDGTDALWKPEPAAHQPPTVVDASLTYLNGYRQLVLFGGRDPVTLEPRDTTYLWGPTMSGGYDWTLATPADSPSARSAAAIAYRPTPIGSREVVLFGGFDGNGDLGDTWIWNGVTWTERTAVPSPPAQNSAAMAQLPGGVLLLTNDWTTWQWSAPDTTAPTSGVALYGTTGAGFTLRSKVQVGYGANDGAYTSGTRTVDVRWRRAAYNGDYLRWHYPAGWQGMSTAYRPRFLEGLEQGYEYCFSSRATDWAGNVGAWSDPTCVARLMDDTRLRGAGGWTRHEDKRFYNGTYITTTTGGARLTRRHAGVAQIAVLVRTSPRAGGIKVTVGGETVGRWSLRSATAQTKVLLVGTPFASSDRPVVITAVTKGGPVTIDGLGLLRG